MSRKRTLRNNSTYNKSKKVEGKESARISLSQAIKRYAAKEITVPHQPDTDSYSQIKIKGTNLCVGKHYSMGFPGFIYEIKKIGFELQGELLITCKAYLYPYVYEDNKNIPGNSTYLEHIKSYGKKKMVVYAIEEHKSSQIEAFDAIEIKLIDIKEYKISPVGKKDSPEELSDYLHYDTLKSYKSQRTKTYKTLVPNNYYYCEEFEFRYKLFRINKVLMSKEDDQIYIEIDEKYETLSNNQCILIDNKPLIISEEKVHGKLICCKVYSNKDEILQYNQDEHWLIVSNPADDINKLINEEDTTQKQEETKESNLMPSNNSVIPKNKLNIRRMTRNNIPHKKSTATSQNNDDPIMSSSEYIAQAAVITQFVNESIEKNGLPDIESQRLAKCSAYYTAMRNLRWDYESLNLIGRDKELREITDFIRPTNNKKSNFLYISGMPGCGKTYTLTYTLKLALSQYHIKYVQINAYGMKARKIYSLIYHEFLRNKRNQKFDNKVAYIDRLTKYFNSEKSATHVISIDEIDSIASKILNGLLYAICEWAKQCPNLLLIGISNQKSYLMREADSKVTSRLGNHELIFLPYNNEQMMMILKDRKGVVDVMTEDSLRYISLKVGNRGGDIRKALEICEESIRAYADKHDEGMIDYSFVRDVYDLKYSPFSSYLRKCSKFDKELIISISVVSKLNKVVKCYDIMKFFTDKQSDTPRISHYDLHKVLIRYEKKGILIKDDNHSITLSLSNEELKDILENEKCTLDMFKLL